MKDSLTINKEMDENRQGEAMTHAPAQDANGKKLYLESYGCAMNFADSEVEPPFLLRKDTPLLLM